MLIEMTRRTIADVPPDTSYATTVGAGRFLWIGIFIVSALLSASFAVATLWVREREESHRLHEVERAIAIAEAHVVDVVARTESVFDGIDRYLAGVPLSRLSDADLRRVEDAFASGAPPGSSLGFWLPDGSGRLGNAGLDAGDRDYFRIAVGRPGPDEEPEHYATEKGSVIGTPTRSPATGRWTLPLSRLARDGDGNPSGVVVVGIPMETFAALHDGLRADKDDLFALWRHDRTMLVRSPFRDDMTARRFADAPVWKIYPASPGGVYEAPTVTDGVKRLVTYKGLPPLPLLYVYAIDRRDISWGAALTYWPLLALGAGAILAAAGYAALSIRYLGRLKSALYQLRALHDNATDIAEARGRFIGTMNHELRTPLNAVIGFAEVLGTQMYGPLGNPKYLEYVNDIAASGRHLLALIDDIMDLSAIDQGARQLGSEDVDLVETLGDVVKFTEATRRRRGIRLSVGGGLPTVTGDGRAVRQIVLNLVTNAIKFSPDGAEVTCVGCGDPGDGTAGLKIVDRGIGIEPEDLGKVGTAFFRTQSAIQKAIPGTGLGLSIAFVLAKKMDGSLTIESSVGSGTTATLLLPVRP